MRTELLKYAVAIYLISASLYALHLYWQYQKEADKPHELYWIPVATYFAIGALYVYAIYTES